MRLHSFLLAAVAAATLAGCMQTPQDRAVAGAVAGALIADATDENIIAGGALGALAGAASCGVPGLPRCY